MKKLIFFTFLLSFVLVACGGTKGDPDNGRALFEQETIGSADALDVPHAIPCKPE